MFRILSKKDKESLQRKGYIYEHLLCLYSSVSDTTALYNNFPIFFNSFGEADIILYGFGEEKEDRYESVEELSRLPINKLNIVSPTRLDRFPKVEVRYIDWDYHINLKEFDLDLKGSAYKHIRGSLKKAEKMGYTIRLSREFTPKHVYIMSRYLSRHRFEAWDYEELLSLDRFFKEHDHGLLMEVYKDDGLMGFDVVDFFEDNRIMVVPLGIYLESPFISDFMMYKNLEFARSRDYEWLDIGPTCGIVGLKRFKEKWLGKPKFKLYVQVLNIKPKRISTGKFSEEILTSYLS
ncbi:MAG: hypothetical protein OEY22_08105 [Candidatus Bathyarchaeota archaeon]|nr:hypothetical protein [Candidatus Bathyarchaeota archaeon]MDH5788615.1 hypothetical protein [Candidatus Bathyarchaeota archaeon]